MNAWRHTSTYVNGPAHSLYFGGGTPSLTPPEIIQHLIDAFPLEPQAEITVEANPGTITKVGLEALRNTGVNRLSLGIQTFNSKHAKKLGRGHNVRQARDLLADVNTIGFDSWSVDLMFALPEQTLDELKADLDILLELQPPHVSLYGLTIEPGTAFASAERTGDIKLPQNDLWRAMYDESVETLQHAGLERYEVSNFARAGHRGRHNESIWRGGHYAGLGPGAHGFLPNGQRTLSLTSISEWLENPHPAGVQTTAYEAAIDQVLSSLRHVDGLDLSTLRANSGHKVDDDAISHLTSGGLLTHSKEHLHLTDAAFPIADGIVRRICDGLYLPKST
jgi:oxygen-independent coproporphyrinogen-3 oxidase